MAVCSRGFHNLGAVNTIRHPAMKATEEAFDGPLRFTPSQERPDPRALDLDIRISPDPAPI
ncbi:uncharacterized protein ColSpa_08879 [Colletotrichum spaethianum]|uniref:Uncharacterized protein n=1 Tax=Colletotrichum spaethianum TaxID=700344 RepID=A0AA37PAJ0_9PEZI|nr:uncharacterized protein ColSpa_08879 [Colletotrichum spaethianum]GKT48698.1 hypothetical protein ColSpa_08879 [Colletotrichum spaethianum]